MNEKLLEEMIRNIISSMENGNASDKTAPAPNKAGKKFTTKDYPLQDKHPESIKTPTNKTLSDISMEQVLKEDVTSNDIRVSPETLELQAQVAESAGRKPLARNLRRAAELTVVPDERILEVYNALRPNRSTKEELLSIADEFENKYNATINANFIREAAEVYEDRGVLRVD